MKKYRDKVLVEAYEIWIRSNGQALQRFIYKQVGNKELAEDIFQEVLISAYIALPSFENRANFKSWIFKIAINKCRDYWRKEKTAQKFWEERVYTYDVDSSIPLPEDSVVNKCSQEEMLDTINELPEKYRESIYLFYIAEQSIMEISSTKKLPISTVKTRIRRAKCQLREKVGSQIAL